MSDLDGLLRERLGRGPSHRRLAGTTYGPRWIAADGRRLLNFSANDYLGLSALPAAEGGAFQPSSRLLSGDAPELHAAEAALAAWLGREACLLYPAGYMANLGLLSAIAQKGDLLLLDRLCHASLIDGARLSRARVERFRHLDLEDLDRQLSGRRDAGATWVVTESLFSMDGDAPDFDGLAELKRRHGFFLVLDEAHAVGVHGPQGRGLLAAAGLEGLADIVTFTLSKSFAMQGGVVAGTARLAEFLVNRSRPFIYTTATPARHLAPLAARLAALAGADAARARLRRLALRLQGELGLRREPWAPIVPVVVGEGDAARAAAARLREAGVHCPAILPPTVPEGTARLRVSLSAAHEDEDLDRLLAALRGAGALRP